MSLPFQRIAVLGGSGFVGRSVCEQLVKAAGGAFTLVVPSRNVARASHLRVLPGIELHAVNVMDDAALRRVLAGCDAVINLVAILHGNQAEFDKAHVGLPRAIAQACHALQIARLVHVSALGVSENAPSMYLRSKWQGEQVLRAAAGLDVTLVRPSVIFGEHDKLLNLFATLQRWFPLVPLAGAQAQLQPVWVEDVAAAVVAALQASPGRWPLVECAGPQTMTLAELVQAAGHAAGTPRSVLPLPQWLAALQARAMALLPNPLMTPDNLASLSVPNVASGQGADLKALGIEASALSAIAPSYLGGAAQPNARYNRWRAHR
jgi:uncharacterized protein YbjT (DUF2867 family)